VEIECGTTSSTAPQPTEIWLNGQRLGAIVPPADLDWRGVDAPQALWRRLNLLELVPADPTAKDPFLAVDRLRFTPD
jgi:hypothetical protein